MTTASATTAFYAKTTLIQYGNTFEALTDFQCAVAGSPTNEETLNHLVACMEDQCFEDVSGDATLDLKGLNAYAYASALVLNEEACKGNGHEFEIYTNFQEADADNWENPLS